MTIEQVSKAYYIIRADKEVITETDDFFAGLTAMKKEPPGSKLMRTSDHKCLNYTRAPRPGDVDLSKIY